MSSKSEKRKQNSTKKPNVTLPGTVEKIIPAAGQEPEKAQIIVEGADDLYREVRIENTLQDADGNQVRLKKDAGVEVTIEAEDKDTNSKD